MKEPSMNYEEAVTRLSEIVTALDRGETSLEESIKLFEEGTKLAGYCQKMLKRAEQKVVKLTKTSEGAVDEIEVSPDDA